MATDPTLVAAIIRSDLYSFIRAIFPIVSPGDPFASNWHIEAIAYHLTLVLQGDLKRLIITLPPRNLKSIASTVAFPAFVLGHDPSKRIICVSYSEGLARKLANDCRAVVQSDLFSRVFPNTRISAGKNTELEFATTRGGNRLATSVGGTLTGRGGNLIIIDDPMKPQDAYSVAERERTRQWFSNTLLSRLDNKAKDAIVVVMQRLHIDDLVGRLLEEGGWYHLNLPAMAEDEESVELSMDRTHLRQAGELLHPGREPRHILEALKKSMGSMDFAAQYQQSPVIEGGNLVKWAWFPRYEKPPDRNSSDRIVVSWDTASSSKELASYSACVVMQIRGETVYLLDVVRERLEYPDLKRKVIELHKRWRYAVNNYSLLIENKGSGMSLIQDLRHDHIHAIKIDPHGDKVMRMNQQTARIEARSVWLPERAPWLADFRQEVIEFPAGRYSDQVDALSQGLNRIFDRSRGEYSCGSIRGLV